MSLRATMRNRKARKNQSRAIYSADAVGSVGLWYGSGKVAFTGKLTFGDYRDDDAVNYSLLLFESEENKKWIFNGIVTLYRNPKSKERQPKVGSVYVYESSKQAAYMMIYMDTDVEGQTETYTCSLVEGNSDNPRACALFGKVCEAKNTNNEIKQKSKLKKAERAIKEAKKTAEDSWYTDLDPEDLMTILKSYDANTLVQFIRLFHEFLDSKDIKEVEKDVNNVMDEERDLGYETVDVDSGYEGDFDYEEDEEEEQEELPAEQPKEKLRIRDIAGKSSPDVSESLIKRVSSQFFEGIDKADIEDIV